MLKLVKRFSSNGPSFCEIYPYLHILLVGSLAVFMGSDDFQSDFCTKVLL